MAAKEKHRKMVAVPRKAVATIRSSTATAIWSKGDKLSPSSKPKSIMSPMRRVTFVVLVQARTSITMNPPNIAPGAADVETRPELMLT
mmetsp:Transcript_26054/g.50688  ORF Transcript_26054/g.50688 Transcript_26054/m.50688 type:complete len:88 (-) Transcript_26054:196-459(-)